MTSPFRSDIANYQKYHYKKMIEEQIEVINKLGLHARAAAKLVKLTAGFKSSIKLDK